LAGITITADCLSQEKREGTLGLLFLTDLKGYDVVLGKLAATSLNALYRLFSVFPILAVPLLLGALTLGEFGRMALVLTNTLFFSLSAGMAASAMSLRERRAMAGTVLLLLSLTAVPPLIGWVMSTVKPSVPYDPKWLLSSAVYPCYLAFDTSYKTQVRQFWTALIVTHALGWSLLGLASVVARRAWRDRPATGTRAVWQERWRSWQFGHGSTGLGHRARLLSINPVLWQVARDRLRSAGIFAALLCLSLVWLGLYGKYGSVLLEPTFYFLTAYCAHTLLKFWLAAEACRPLAEERWSGTLEVLLSTPLSVDEILKGELLALKHQFGWPVLVVLVADCMMLLASFRDSAWDPSNDWVVLCVMLMIVFVADLYTLAWVGLWLSLNARRGSHAVAGTVGRVLVLPWAVLILGFSLLALFPWVTFEPGELGVLTIAFAVCLLNNAIFYSWAKVNLREQFRLTATQRFQMSSAFAAHAAQAGTSASPATVGAGAAP
jgi:hypothetical protein